LDTDVTKDAYAQPSLPPDGKYRAKLKLEGIKKDNGEKKDFDVFQTKGGRSPVTPYFATSVSASLIDPTGKFDGMTLYPQFGGRVGTLLRRDKSTQVGTLLALLHKPDGTPWATANMRLTQREWIELLVKALAGEPEIGIETQWEVTCQVCQDQAKEGEYPVTIRGMQKFPPETDAAKLKAGERFSPEMRCGVNAGHGYTRAYPKVARFISLKDLAAAGVK
jgi:hypothetical protein